MEEPTEVFLFGDQTNSFDTGLKQLFKIKDNVILTSFFESAYFTIRSEVGRLPASQRQLFPRFTSIVDLLARCRELPTPNTAVESCLTSVYQLACFFSYYGSGSRPYPSPANTLLVASCTGLLAAAAVSSARDVAELLATATTVLKVSFRTGLKVLEVSRHVQRPTDSSCSWSTIVPGIEVAKATSAIEAFCNEQALPLSQRPYISAVSASGLTISGPCDALNKFCTTPAIARHRILRVPIYGPYHARHLYDEIDVDRILQSCLDEESQHTPVIPILSCSTGNKISATSYQSFLKFILNEILRESLRWDKMMDSCFSTIKSRKSSRCLVIPVGQANGSQSLFHALKEIPKLEVAIDARFHIDNSKFETKAARPQEAKIAITGLSGRFPDASSPDAFWDLLYRGLDVHKEVPAERFDVRTHVDPSGKKKNTSATPFGCFVPNPGHFDPRFFNMSPREASQTDPMQRLAILTAYEALEMSGFVANRTPSTQRDRVGIFYGQVSDDWREINSGQNIDTYFIPGGIRAFTPGRINYHFKFSGPSINVDTACSSSLAAIHMAMNALRAGDCDTAIAGGTNVLTNPDIFAGLDRGHFLSRTGNCKTFDDSADGYCRADGVGTIVMKRLEDAKADNDPILGVICGAATNHSAEAVSITRPHAGAQAFLFDKILEAASVDPLDISYIEMHGTGTQAGDAVEMKSVLTVFSPDEHKRKPDQTLHLGAAKANIGHGESASGVSSLIKVLLMMQKNTIPPHCGIKTKINHGFPTDLAERGIRIALEPTPWNRPHNGKGKRRVFVNNFSAAGGNTALLLEDGPLQTVSGTDPRNTHVVTISARSKDSLRKNVESLITHINANQNMSLPCLSYTTTARRMHHNFRATVSGSSLSAVRESLTDFVRRDDFSAVPAVAPKVGFAFTGQGSHYLAMGKQFYEHFSQFKEDILDFNNICQTQGFPPILPLIDGSIKEFEKLTPLVVQLGATCLQMALARLWASWGVKPNFVIGHSLGEYAALNVAGVLSASDAIYLCAKRASLLQNHCTAGTHAMLAVNASVETLSPYLGQTGCEIACINGPEATVISGVNSHIDKLAEDVKANGLKCTKLQVPFAFHSAQVDPILREFEDSVRGVVFHTPEIPVISPLLGQVITDASVFGPSYMRRHCREAVNFLGALQTAQKEKLATEKTIWIEIGSHPVCVGMIKSIFSPKMSAFPTMRKNEDTWKVLVGTLASLHSSGVELNWAEYHRDFESALQVLQLPAYNWDLKDYWIQYVNDWALTKGDIPANAAITTTPHFVSKLSTTTVQRIIEEHADGSKATVVMESDIAEPALREALMGHKVNGAPLAPSSVYADIAFTLAEYMQKEFDPKAKNTWIEVAEMEVAKPLIAKGGKQLFRATAQVDFSKNEGTISVYSVTSEGKKTLEHGNCRIKYGDAAAWRKEWERTKYLVKGRVDTLRKGVLDGSCHMLKRGMAYKLFGALVSYDQKYRGMEEVILDSPECEATARITFQATGKEGKFHMPPYWADSLGALSGFVMNANDAVDSKSQIFINHGWQSLRYSQTFSPDKTYRSYVKMQLVSGTLYSGDVYIFEEDTIVALFEGVKFQGIPRKIIDLALPPAGAAKPAARPTPAASKASRPAAKAKSASVPHPAKPAGPSLFTKALAIVAEEVGIEASELTDSTAFADHGIDSLMALTITGRFREELDLPMEIESSLFSDHPIVSDMKAFFAKHVPGSSANAKRNMPALVDSSSGVSTPLSGTESESYSSDDESATSVSDNDAEDDVMSLMRKIIAEEVGIAPSELTPTTLLTDFGLDSLMALTILGRLRESVDMEFPPDLFSENETLSAVQSALGLKPKAKPTSSSRSSRPAPSNKVSPPSAQPSLNLPRATSICLQGNLKTAKKILFLWPDGSGSSTSYSQISNVGKDIAVIGLNCPFMKQPEGFTMGLDDLMPAYLEEVRRRQPKGPYYIGGWSAGGVCALEASHQLHAMGERVEKLIVIDAPYPVGLEPLPERLIRFFDSLNLFGADKSKPAPEWLVPHFLAAIRALDDYKKKVRPFVPFSKSPPTHMIWAEDGIAPNAGKEGKLDMTDAPPTMLWLLNNRTDFGSNGWETLLGKANIKTTSLRGANHFSMMMGDGAKRLGELLGKAMT